MAVGVLVVMERLLKGAGVNEVVRVDSGYRGMNTSLMGRPDVLILMGLVADGSGSNRFIK